MNRYQQLLESLALNGAGQMTCRGGSMRPVLSNPSNCVYRKQDNYAVGDIVFCKVGSRYIDAHFITKTGPRGYMISNNHGLDNGWTKSVFGVVVSATDKNGRAIYRKIDR